MERLTAKEFTFTKHARVKNGYLIQCEKAPILNCIITLRVPFTEEQKEEYLNTLGWAYYIGQRQIQRELRNLLNCAAENHSHP